MSHPDDQNPYAKAEAEGCLAVIGIVVAIIIVLAILNYVYGVVL